jgi:hypothetical protein
MNWTDFFHMSDEEDTKDSVSAVVNPELVLNGSFSSDTQWVKPAGCTISGGVSNWNTVLTAQEMTQDIGMIPGSTYKVEFDLINVTEGGVRPKCGAQLGINRTADGHYSENIVCNTSGVFAFRSVLQTTLQIDNVSVKLV